MINNQEDLKKCESYYPLNIKVCTHCWLVQTEDYADARDFFNADYAYFSSTSSSWLKHAKLYSEKIRDELNLNHDSFVIEVASNDGYLLQYFKNKKNISKILGIEPTPQAAKLAKKKNINTVCKFFSYKFSKNYKNFDLIIANNVIAHIPDINDFVKGIKNSLSPKGVATIEFQYLVNLIKKNQFDNIL
jgi:2-polyprenyl-3-methyl-5-hydroxy-6-metoxy-1,4-benzoquinol methylase